MSESPDAVFVILSDLHFGPNLLPTSDVPWPLFQEIELPKLFGHEPEIGKFILERCITHDISIVATLPLYLQSLLPNLPSIDDRRPESFDLYLVLGDLTTCPFSSSFELLRRYLTEQHCESPEGNFSVSCAGLKIDPSKLVIIPGNHDKLFMTDLDFFHRNLLGPLHLPIGPKPQSSYMLSRRVREREFLFIMVDANKYATEVFSVDTSCRKHLASGEISKGLRGELMAKLAELAKKRRVDDAELDDYRAATRIMLVHYAADIRSVIGLKLESLILPHNCLGLDNLIGDLGQELDLVLHGHLHFPKIYQHMGTPIISASTTTQKDGYNGFFLLKFFRSGEIRTEHHRWFGTGFLPDPEPSLKRTIFSRRSTSASAKAMP